MDCGSLGGPAVRTFLLTGYNPHRNVPDYNLYGMIALNLDGRRVGGCRISGQEIPVAVKNVDRSFVASWTMSVPTRSPRWEVAPGRSSIGVERVALNVLELSVPDNRGRRHRDKPIRRGCPA